MRAFPGLGGPTAVAAAIALPLLLLMAVPSCRCRTTRCARELRHARPRPSPAAAEQDGTSHATTVLSAGVVIRVDRLTRRPRPRLCCVGTLRRAHRRIRRHRRGGAGEPGHPGAGQARDAAPAISRHRQHRGTLHSLAASSATGARRFRACAASGRISSRRPRLWSKIRSSSGRSARITRLRQRSSA